MEERIQRPPECQEVGVQANDVAFYIVSPRKFLILFLGTIGFYGVYWFYKNWSLYKQSSGEAMWPVMRGVFSIFFVHALFELVENKYKEKAKEATKCLKHLASIYVVFVIIGNVCDRLASKEIGSPYTDYVFLITLPIICWALYHAQIIINVVCNDAAGSSNNKLTFPNFIWLVLGGVIWALLAFGLYAVSTGLI